MADVPVFTVCPPLRCHFRMHGQELPFCGRPARWIGSGNAAVGFMYFCDVHRPQFCSPIGDTITFRRVRLIADVLFAATSLAPAEAHAEALGRLERLVDQAGGVLNLHTASSVVGRFGPQALATPHIVGPAYPW